MFAACAPAVFGATVLLWCDTATGRAQAPAECATSECSIDARQPARLQDPPLLADAAAASQLKRQFVDALQRFVRAQAGTFGDEGAELDRSLSDMESTLERWDASIEALRARASRLPATADVHLVAAVVLLDRLRVHEAIRELEAAIRSEDGRADVHALAALAYRLAGRPADATRALQRAAALDRDNPAVFYALAQPWASPAGSEAASQTRRGFQRAVRARSAVTRAGTPAGPFERIDLLKQAGGVAPVFAEARYLEGFARLNEADYREALARFRTTAHADPLVTGQPETRDRRVQAASLLRAAQVDTARRQLESAAEAAPDDSETHRILALACWVGDDAGCAISHLRSAIRLVPSDSRARSMLARVFVEDGRAAEAEHELMQTLESGLVSGSVHYQLAQLYQRRALPPQASQQLEKAGQYGPIVGRDHFFRLMGSLLVDQADFDGAVAAYTRRIDVNPNSAEAHRQLGEIFFLQGRNEEALLEATTAAWLDPADARALAGVGQAHVRATAYPEAVIAFRRALELDGGLQEARYGLATSLLRSGKADEARSQMAIVERLQSEAAARGRLAFQVDALRREASGYLIAGTLDDAIRVLSEILRADDSARSRRELSVALMRAGRTVEAVEHLEAARRLDESPEVLALLAAAYETAGRREDGARLRVQQRRLIEQARLDRLR
ncbi:MAG TPA: tetratricopeptide repeat protein [Vicinamibacterales bacterium]|nr:tetratricopeptide repeat protein [Vicinamibacterales bacterium]